jgi:hypothetical protein
MDILYYVHIQKYIATKLYFSHRRRYVSTILVLEVERDILYYKHKEKYINYWLREGHIGTLFILIEERSMSYSVLDK